ncbi:MAG: hypothetical protein E7256_07340 [Lachnospiraceae bacterium]|nr:hypothetical protein [Lachnospiraceae bacterium]
MRELIKKLTPKPLIELYKKLRYVWIQMLFRIFHLFPIQKNRIVLCNVWGYGDNARYVAEELLRKQDGEEICFVTNHPETAGEAPGIRFLKTNSVAAVKALATARVWVENNRKEPYITKRKGQYYIQLWHGGLALKKIEGDCAEHLGEAYIQNAKRDSAMTDLYVSNGEFCTNMYRRAFFYEGEILECGTPRNDAFIKGNPEKAAQVKRRLSIPDDTKIVLYAPTYRDGSDVTAYQFDFEQTRKAMEKRFGGRFIMIVRLHPLVAALGDVLVYSDKILNGSHYPDMYELMLASDVLITDYSNTMFEFSMMRRPVFLYASDFTAYKKERGFYFDYYTLPYPIAANTEEMIQNITNFSEELYKDNLQSFFDIVALKESGRAAEAVAEKVLEKVR